MARAATLLGHAPEVGLISPLTLDAQVFTEPDGAYRLELRSESASIPSSRSIRASSCAEVADAAALLLALAIDPSRASLSAPANAAFESEAPAANPEPGPANESKHEPTAPPTVDEPPRKAAAPSSQRRGTSLTWFAGGSLAIWARRLPALAPGPLGDFGLAAQRWELRASLGFFPSQHGALPNQSAGGDVWLLEGGASLGYAATASRLRITPQLGLGVGWMHGDGSGVSRPEAASLGLVSVDAGARLALQVSRSWFLVGHGLFSGLVTRPRFVLDSGDEVHRPDALGVRFGFGAEWRQP